MRDFKGKVAVITGAASGIGFALAQQACREGMNVVLADIDEGNLARACKALGDLGTEVLPVITNVGSAESVESLAQTCFETYGQVNLLCNNAGIDTGSDFTDLVWQIPLQDWEDIIHVNLWGVIHGCRSFAPRMVEQKTEGVILNTASMISFFTTPNAPAYILTKHAVMSLSEVLSKQLSTIESLIKVAVLCPELTSTTIMDTAVKDWEPRDAQARETVASMKEMVNSATAPSETASYAFQALRKGHFYLFPKADLWDLVTDRVDQIKQAKADQIAD